MYYIAATKVLWYKQVFLFNLYHINVVTKQLRSHQKYLYKNFNYSDCGPIHCKDMLSIKYSTKNTE